MKVRLWGSFSTLKFDPSSFDYVWNLYNNLLSHRQTMLLLRYNFVTLCVFLITRLVRLVGRLGSGKPVQPLQLEWLPLPQLTVLSRSAIVV